MRLRRASPGIDFVEFVEQRAGALFRTAYVLTGDAHTAEDLVQEALERACRHWRRVARAEVPEAYVRRILVNLANDRWRRLHRSGERPAPEPVIEHPDPRDAYRSVELRAELVAALHTLPMGMRTVVVLYYLHDLGDREIAQTLDISPGAVRSQLARGLAKLRAALPRQDVPSASSTSREGA
ncbi:SigE family RNA polymerase sigma factor [Kitasatospora sp. NPDC091257]|uniref:SigE family RNA polymerase sigma factor n=1 Tax=Kitasatospora sp. NPDC091257 TaxID=3364084 RepID=UPI00381E83B8